MIGQCCCYGSQDLLFLCAFPTSREPSQSQTNKDTRLGGVPSCWWAVDAQAASFLIGVGEEGGPSWGEGP